jgi:phosphonopyruvate decarboxylase
MISPQLLYEFFQYRGINFYTGVPDSLLKNFLKYIQDFSTNEQHVITANEGLAVGLAAGYHFSTGKVPVVYLQNSGLGNIINPLTSLADEEMYSVPMLIMIGWRGRPGVKDEPQHKKMGRITISMLNALEIPFIEVHSNDELPFKQIGAAIDQVIARNAPVALLCSENLFEEYAGETIADNYLLQRETVISHLIRAAAGDELFVCTTGKLGREFYEQNKNKGEKIKKYLLSVGAMGHANHIALGYKIHSEKKVVMLDGDGALLMHMGALPAIARLANDNFIHVVINNGSHESVGGQPTDGFFVDFCAIAKACGYMQAISISTENELNTWLATDFLGSTVQFVEIRTDRSSRQNLGRPADTPVDMKNNLMKN